MRVSSKGQVTIPKAVRERLGIRGGSEVLFIETSDDVMLVKARSSDGKQIVDEMRARSAGQFEFNTDELMELTRGDA